MRHFIFDGDLLTASRTAAPRREKRGSTSLHSSAASADQSSPSVTPRRAAKRRHVDPTTCERDYSDDELEFMRAIDQYKRHSGRPFPTWSEVLEVVKGLGYRREDAPALGQ
ncbi:MAG: hypothetical protein ACKV0T_31050 [Planctomycetales bacterium]